MKRLRVTDFGPIRQADVKFGDLTVLVGPQASGKSLFVQLYKLIEDAPAIAAELERYGFDWRDSDEPLSAFCSLYFGSGLEDVLTNSTQVLKDSRRLDPVRLAIPHARSGIETVFVIPAQRVLALQDGWPKPFMAYGSGDPYVTRQFSESIRTLMEQLRGHDIRELIFNRDFRQLIDAAIYTGSTLEVKREGMRRQLVMKPSGASAVLPYSVWSAGQREFTPLLLGLSAARFGGWRNESRELTGIVEEPEMGLHPRAIIGFGLHVLDLLARGNRVILSTHSPVILDLVWAIRELSGADPTIGAAALCKIFDVDEPSDLTQSTIEEALKKSYRTYFFNRTESGIVTQDISSLDPGSEDENVAGWGGLSGFSGRIAQIVGEAMSK
jgi:hypothetical protein